MEKEYYLIRHKQDHELYLHDWSGMLTDSDGYILCSVMNMEYVVLELKSEAERIISLTNISHTLELYPINDYIANRKTPIQK